MTLETFPASLEQMLSEYSQLSQDYQRCIAPYQQQIKALEIERDNAVGDLIFQMETLEALIKPLILEAKQTQKVPFLTAVYSKRSTWNTDLLMSMAEEVPTLMQAYSITESVSFRKTSQ